MSLSRKKVWKIFAVLMFLAAISLLFTGCSLFTKTYNINYVLNGGINNSFNPSTFTKNDEVLFKAAKKVGYEFDGWYFDKAFSQKTEKIEKGTKADVTIYAKWTPKTYVLTYDTNEGTFEGEENSKNVVFDSAYGDLPTPTRSGYCFLGWCTDSDCEDIIEENSIVKIASDHTIYAKWGKNFKITLNSLGATNPGTDELWIKYTDKAIYFDEDCQKPFDKIECPSRDGFLFEKYEAQWNQYNFIINENGLFDSNTSTNLKFVTDDLSLTSIWSGKNYNLSIDPNYVGAQQSTTSYKSAFGLGVSVDFELVKRTHYNLIGFEIVSCDGGNTYKEIEAKLVKQTLSGLKLKVQIEISAGTYGNIAIKAIWEPEKYTITYHSDFGDDETITKTYNYFEKNDNGVYWTVLNADAFDRKGYTLTGWENANSAGVYFVLGANITSEDLCGNYTLKAVWKPKTYTVRFESNGGTIDRDSILVTFDEKIKGDLEALPEPKYTGYAFGGWYLDSKYKNKVEVQQYLTKTFFSLQTTMN